MVPVPTQCKLSYPVAHEGATLKSLRTHSLSVTLSSLLLAILLVFVFLVLIDAVTSKTERKRGLVEAKYFSPEFTVSSVQLATDAKGEAITMPTQQTYPESYEVEIDEGCRFSVPRDAFQRILVGDRIGYRESRGYIIRNCEWDPQ